jgi:hypothetical protein
MGCLNINLDFVFYWGFFSIKTVGFLPIMYNIILSLQNILINDRYIFVQRI